MPGSATTPDPRSPCGGGLRDVAFHVLERVGIRDKNPPHFAYWVPTHARRRCGSRLRSEPELSVRPSARTCWPLHRHGDAVARWQQQLS